MRRGDWRDHREIRNRHLSRPLGKLRAIARALYEPPITEDEAKSEGFELEDYDTDVIEVWPDNELALSIFQRVGTKWLYPPMGGAPNGLRWEAIYPLMDHAGATGDAWQGLHDDLTVMEHEAIATMKEFAPKTNQK